MNFNIFSKQEEDSTPSELKPAESTVTLTIDLADGTEISEVDKVYSLDEYEKSKEESKKKI